MLEVQNSKPFLYCGSLTVEDSCWINLVICIFCCANRHINTTALIHYRWTMCIETPALPLFRSSLSFHALEIKSCGVLVNWTMVKSLSPLSVHLRFVPLTPRPCHYTARPYDEDSFSKFRSFQLGIILGCIHWFFVVFVLWELLNKFKMFEREHITLLSQQGWSRAFRMLSIKSTS